MVVVHCPKCGKKYELPEAAIGKRGNCGDCFTVFLISATACVDPEPAFDTEWNVQPVLSTWKEEKPETEVPPTFEEVEESKDAQSSPQVGRPLSPALVGIVLFGLTTICCSGMIAGFGDSSTTNSAPSMPIVTTSAPAHMIESHDVSQAAHESGFSESEIREAMRLAYLSSAKPTNDADALIIALGYLQNERQRQAGAIPSTPADRDLDRLDAQSESLKQRMNDWMRRVDRDGYTPALRAEGAELEKERERLLSRYHEYIP